MAVFKMCIRDRNSTWNKDEEIEKSINEFKKTITKDPFKQYLELKAEEIEKKKNEEDVYKRQVLGITVGHEMVGVVCEVGSSVTNVKPGDRVTVNVETFCGECFFCQNGFVNNCTDENGGWALGCRIDGGQAEYVRVPYANQGQMCIRDRHRTV